MFQPLNLRVVRETSLANVLTLDDCIIGHIYNAGDFFQIADPGTQIGVTLELPYRGNQNEISAIDAGLYSGKVREDGPLGWRIELLETNPRKVIQLHIGNIPENTRGCILVGKERGAAACTITESRATRDEIKALYGANTGRPIQIKVE